MRIFKTLKTFEYSLFFISLLVSLISVSSANAAPSTAALSATINGSEAGPVSIEYTVTLDSVNDTGGTIFFEIDPTGGNRNSGR